MKNLWLNVWLLSLILVAVIACNSPRAKFNTIATLQAAGKSAFDGYVDGVIRGNIRTNELPAIGETYDAFQASVRVAIIKASGDSNAPVSPDLTIAGNKLFSAINLARKK